MIELIFYRAASSCSKAVQEAKEPKRQQQPDVKCIFEQKSETWNFHLRAESGLGQFRD